MTVRAKFVVAEKTQRKAWSGNSIETVVKLRVVSGDTEENKKFFQFTPSGTIDLGTINPDIVKVLEIGKEFYVDFTEAN